MKGRSTQKVLVTILVLLCGLTLFSTAALAADGGEISAFFGTDTTTTISGDRNTATASGNGTGGKVKYGNTNLVNGTIPGYSTNSNRELDITVDPDPGYQVVWVKVWRRGQSWDDKDVDNPATGDTTFERKVEDGRKYYVAVLFELVSINYNVSYTIAADNPAGTNCNTTATVNPPSPYSVAANATASFTITNTNASCAVDSVKYDTGGFSTTGLAGNVYTTPAITKNVSIQIRYRGSSYTITSTVDSTGSPGCGTISPGTQAYVAAANQMFTITKNSGCAIDSVLVDGANVTAAVTAAANTYTFSNIQASHTITVKYVATVSTPGDAYCQVPPFMSGQNALKPNVLILFDNSGSMGEDPYSGKTYDCTETGAKSTLAACTNFYGYFDNEKMYKAGGTSEYLIDTAATLNLSPATGTGTGKGMSGNYLNFKNTKKVDVMRKILIGGQVATGTGYSARGSATGGTNKRFLLTEGGKKIEYGTSDPTGIIQSVYDKVRFGIMVFNGNSGNKGTDDGGYILAPLGTSLSTLISHIESNNTDPDGYTPLAESLYEAMRYYRGTTSAYNSGVDYGNTTSFPVTDPFSRHAIQASCQKHFVLVLTDGEPTNDGNVPSNGTNTNITDTSFSNWWTTVNARTLKPSTLMGRVGYYAHTHDMLDLTKTPTDLNGINNLTIYTVFTFDDSATGITTLKEAARFGSFVETPAAHNAQPDISTEYSTDGGTTINNYYQADDGEVLKDNISSALSKIISSTASGTAAAVANNKSGERGANMIQALFYPQWPNDNSVKWLGEVQALWYYLDPVISFSGIYEDTNRDKVLDINTDQLPPKNPFETKALWRAGAELQTTTSASRKIYTLLNSTTDLTATSNEFITANLTSSTPTLKSKMLIPSAWTTQADILVNYIRGDDNSLYRPRLVNFTAPGAPTGTPPTNGVWKLGDIINSTPQVQSSVAINAYQNAYSDITYDNFTKSSSYKSRNVVYTGSNDGLFHAFRLGTVSTLSTTNQFEIARMSGTDVGKEEWAFIPSNALPYIQNQAGVDYCHQSLVDGAPTVVDASISNYCSASNYWECDRIHDSTNSSWKSVVVSSMGLGGASRDIGINSGNCNETYNPDTNAANNTDCVKTPVAGDGMSSYFALDVTDPLVPKHMWEFSDTKIPATAKAYKNDGIVSDIAAKGLGLTTTGAAIIRVASVDNLGKVQKKKNGRWFAVIASGPTGSIDSGNAQFTGRSDQNLKIYIIDLNGGSTFTQCTSAGQTGCNYWVKDTGIPFAFANSLSGSAIDLDRWNSTKDGNFSDSVVYVTYTKASLTYHSTSPVGDFPSSATAWNKGGVMRLVTNHNPDPFTWFTSPLIDNIGPITTSIGKIQDRSNKKLWVYFGEGRYFFPTDETNVRRRFYGVADPCYTQYGDAVPSGSANADNSDNNFAMGKTVATCPSVSGPAITDSYTSDVSGIDLQRQDIPSATLSAGKKGWYINMAPATGGSAGAERVVSDVTAAFNGVIFYTTFIPNTDPCVPGGSTSVWAVDYKTGGTPAYGSLQGKAPVQTSSGGVKLIDLATSFTEPGSYGRKLASGLSPMGMAPKGRFPPLLQPKASKRILNIQEQ